jgi:hypothetical protein
MTQYFVPSDSFDAEQFTTREAALTIHIFVQRR